MKTGSDRNLITRESVQDKSLRTWQLNSTFCPTNAVRLLGFTKKCGLRNIINAAARDCLCAAILVAIHLYTPLSDGRVSKILKLPLSVIVILKVERYK